MNEKELKEAIKKENNKETELKDFFEINDGIIPDKVYNMSLEGAEVYYVAKALVYFSLIDGVEDEKIREAMVSLSGRILAKCNEPKVTVRIGTQIRTIENINGKVVVRIEKGEVITKVTELNNKEEKILDQSAVLSENESK